MAYLILKIYGRLRGEYFSFHFLAHYPFQSFEIGFKALIVATGIP